MKPLKKSLFWISKTKQLLRQPPRFWQGNSFNLLQALYTRKRVIGYRPITLNWSFSSRYWKSLPRQRSSSITSSTHSSASRRLSQRHRCSVIPTCKRGEMARLEYCLHTHNREVSVSICNVTLVKRPRWSGSTHRGQARTTFRPMRGSTVKVRQNP